MGAEISRILQLRGGVVENVRAILDAEYPDSSDDERGDNPWRPLADHEEVVHAMHSVTMEHPVATFYNDREAKGDDLRSKLSSCVCVLCGRSLKLRKAMTVILCNTPECALYYRSVCWSCSQVTFAFYEGEPIQACFFCVRPMMAVPIWTLTSDSESMRATNTFQDVRLHCKPRTLTRICQRCDKEWLLPRGRDEAGLWKMCDALRCPFNELLCSKCVRSVRLVGPAANWSERASICMSCWVRHAHPDYDI